MRDDTLADMASQAPQDAKSLKKIRNISSDMAEGTVGKQLIKIIKDTLSTPKETWPEVVKKKPLPTNKGAVVDALRMLLKIECALNDVAPKLVATTDDLEALALEKPEEEIQALKGWRRKVFGNSALALKGGELAIGLKGTKIVKYKVSKETEIIK